MTKPFEYKPKDVDSIVIRKFSFEFPDDLDPNWIPDQHVRSHLFNGLSLTMPYLEPYLIESTQKASKHIDNKGLLDDMRGFNGQEARHYQCHRRLNELLKANGYPELAEVEADMKQSYQRLSERSLTTQLAYNAGFECMTNGFTHWLITKRYRLFKDSTPEIASFWLMHMVEETEHKTVAFDTYMAYSGKYLPRAFGVFHGTLHLVGWGMVGMLTCLRKDKVAHRPGVWLDIVRELGAFVVNVGPFILRALKPGYDPRQEDNPEWYEDWIAGHAQLSPDSALPLLDTTNPNMPVPFEHPA